MKHEVYSTFRKRSPFARTMSLVAAWLMALAPILPVTPGFAAEGDITDNSGLIPFDQAYFAFEVESVLGTLKEVPIWDEIEQMLDNPYQIELDPTVAGNYQYWSSYRSTQERRRSFIFRDGAGNPCAPGSAGCVEVQLSKFLVHPLNYNHMNGEELRLLNIDYQGGPWQIPQRPDGFVLIEASNTDPTRGALGAPVYEVVYEDIDVSPGEDRIEEDEAAIDHNSPIRPDDYVCITTAEPIPVEGAILCGGDPGEPGYMGFGVLPNNPNQRAGMYSTPALPLPAGSDQTTDITQGLGMGQRRLYDPARGFINPRNAGSGVGGLRKPSLRVMPWGNGAEPGYLANSEANLEDDPAALVASNENDYYRGVTRAQKAAARDVAAALGKAVFWDMQVGSDGVQACASCHFKAGIDDRTKNQTNPNHLGGDLTLQLHGGVQNSDLTLADFPFQRGGQDTSNDPGNPFGNVNDVASSMGVVFSEFSDIEPIGEFIVNGSGVDVVPPDIRNPDAVDPIPVFQDLRRVEPRHTPTFFASALNFDNFWDGRARHDFNGGSVFGPSDPQHHVWVDDGVGNLEATRQIIRFGGLASLFTGPGLSEFEMSFFGRNWAKIAKKLLQDGATPLASQLVEADDSFLGPYSNQGGAWCLANARPTAIGIPGLCVSYNELIQMAYYDALWENTTMHLDGCYAGPPGSPQSVNSPQCSDIGVVVAIPVLEGGAVVEKDFDPFDGYVLSLGDGPADPADTNQFTQMEANFPLLAGLAVQAWANVLIPDDAPSDRFFDVNPDVFMSFGEAQSRFLVPDLLSCGDINPSTGMPQGQPCLTEVGNFKRDAGVIAQLNCTVETCDNPEAVQVAVSGTRMAGDPDPLLGLDFFLGSNLSLKNPNFQSLRCGECHKGGTLTDHTSETSHQVSFIDWVPEFNFGQPGSEAFPEPLGRERLITGFSLEGELQENAQDGIERNLVDFCTVEPCMDGDGNFIPGGVKGGAPQGQALLDNGVYNIGVTPIANDVSRGGTDAFGWPLSLARLALKNLGGTDYSPGGDNPAIGWAQPPSPGIPLPNFDPDIDVTGGGILEPSAQDQLINPGFEEEPCPTVDDEGECIGLLPPYLAPWASNIVVGDEVSQDEVFIGLNTLCAEPILEGFVDAFGPFNPAATIGENFNMARQAEMATWPNVNRVQAEGAFKAAPLHNIALSGPYFHNGGKVTLRQQLDFYIQGGDFPLTNKAHRDFLIMNLFEEDEALGGCVNANGTSVTPVDGFCPAGSEPEFTAEEKEEIIVAVVDFLLELTDERVLYERAPFDHPEIFVPLDGTAPDNTFGRPGLLAMTAGDCGGAAGAGPCFRQVEAVGMGGNPTPLENFLGVSNGPRLVGAAADCALPDNHYCH